MGTIGNLAVGSSVYIYINGTRTEFLIVHQGLPSSMYDSSCDGTWLLAKNTFTSLDFDSSNNDYKNSDIAEYLNGTFYDLIDSTVRAQIKQVKIPYYNGVGSSGSVSSGASGLSTKVFLLAAKEVGIATVTGTFNADWLPDDGWTLDYFSNGESDRVATDASGTATSWWLRSTFTIDSNDVWAVYPDGAEYHYGYSTSQGVRPAFIVPSSTTVDDNNNITVNTAPTAPSSISASGSFLQGGSCTVSWGASTDADGDSITYKLYAYYSTSSSWTLIYSGSSTSYTHTLPSNTTSVRYYVYATDGTADSANVYSSTYSVSKPNTAPTTPASLSVPSSLVQGAAATISWSASSDADGDSISYRLEASYNSGSYSVVYSGSSTSVSVTMPTDKTSVTFRVRAYDGKAYSSYITSSSRTISAANTAPAAPGTISASGEFVQGSEITVSWGASTDADGDSITYYLETAYDSGSYSFLYSGANTSYSLTLPSDKTSVVFRVRAYDGKAYSAYTVSASYAISAPAANSAPTVPSSITVPSTIYSGSNAVISWGASTDPDGDAVTYSLECAYDSGAYSVIYSGTALTYTHAVSSGKSTVTYRVRATDGSLYSDYKTADTVTLSTAPVTRPKYPASSAALSKFAADAMQIAKITFSGVDETLTITNNDIVGHGLTIDRTVCSGNSIEIGSCIASEMQLILDNHSGKWNDVKFEGAEMYVQVGVKLDDGTTEYCPFGYFTVDEVPRKLKTITLTALDRMVMFDKPFDSTKIAFPCTVAYLVDRLCTICGVTLRSTLSGMPNASYSVLDAPVGDDITYRQMLSWCLEIMGACAFIDWTGQLVVGWYETTSTVLTTANRYSSGIFENAISITGVDITYDDVVYSAGEDGYKLNIVGNGLIQSKPNEIAANIYSTVSKLSYKPFSAVTKPYIDIYPMDVFSFKDASNNVSAVAVTATNFCLNGNLSVKGTGETSQRRGYAASNPLTARERVIIEDVARRAANDVTREESAALQLNETIANSFGLHRIEVEEADGSTTYYFADKSALADASIIYTFRSGGFAWTTSWNSGNPVWQYGITKDGNALLKTLSVYKLTADYIDAGTLTVQKVLSKHGNTTISIDPTTGMQISTGSVKLFSVNTDSVDVKLSANSISLEATETGGTTSTVTEDVGLVTYSSDDTYYFAKPSGSDYYVSNNNGVANSYAYAKVYFSFDEATTVNLSCISYGESNYDYGIISTVDAELAHSNTADTSNVLKSFKGESSSSAVNVSVTVPSGIHFITIKYIKDGSTDSGNDTLQFRATVTKTVTTGNNGAKLTLKSGGTVLNSANISFTGFVTFNDLAQTGKTTINGANITTGTISADRIDTSTLTVEEVQFKGDKTKTILTSNVKSSYAQTYLGIERSLSAAGDAMYLQAADIMLGVNPSDATLRFDLSTASEAIIRANSSSDTLQIGTNARRAKVYAGELYAEHLTLGANETARLYVEGTRIFFEAANGNVYRIDTTIQS